MFDGVLKSIFFSMLFGQLGAKTIDFNEELHKDTKFVEEVIRKKDNLRRTLKGMPKNISVAMYLARWNSLYKKYPLKIDELVPQGDKRVPPSIPRIIHHIWFGGKLPEQYQQWRETWRAFHPGWEMYLWDEEMVKRAFPQGFFNEDIFREAAEKKLYARMANIARYEILARYGGLYVDTDSFCLRSFDQLHDDYDFYAAMEAWVEGSSVNNAIIGVRPFHPIIIRCIELVTHYRKNIPQRLIDEFRPLKLEPEVVKTFVTTGPKVFTLAIYEKAGLYGSRDIVLPVSFSSPLENLRSEATFCVHEYHHTCWKKDEKS